jgi:hypothetical protein
VNELQSLAVREKKPIQSHFRPALFALTPIRSMGWVIGASRPEAEAMAPVISCLLYHARFLLFAVVGAFLIAWAIARRMALPIKRIQKQREPSDHPGCGPDHIDRGKPYPVMLQERGKFVYDKADGLR